MTHGYYFTNLYHLLLLFVLKEIYFLGDMLFNFILNKVNKLFKKFKTEYPEVHKEPVIENFHGTEVCFFTII